MQQKSHDSSSKNKMFLKSKENYKKATSIYFSDQSPVPPKNFLAHKF